jgi:hypothetical protein
MSWMLMRRRVSLFDLWPMLLIASLILSNVTESDFLGRNSIYTIVPVAVVGQALAGRRRSEQEDKTWLLEHSQLNPA